MPTDVIRIRIRASLIAWIVSAAVVMPLTAGLDVVVVNGNSMSPSLKDGQRVLVMNARLLKYLPGGSYFWLKRGAMVVVSDYRTNGRRWVKRLVGVGGDRIQLQDDYVIVNGDARDQQALPQSPEAIVGSIRDIIVPANQYFLVSDNRSSGLDSRTVGPFARSAVVGIVLSLNPMGGAR